MLLKNPRGHFISDSLMQGVIACQGHRICLDSLSVHLHHSVLNLLTLLVSEFHSPFQAALASSRGHVQV